MVRCRQILRNHLKKLTLIGLLIFYFFGVFTFFLEKSFSDYLGQVDVNIPKYVDKWLNNEMPPRVYYNYNYNFIHKCEQKCDNDRDLSIRLVYIVKSATRNFERREGIRNSWGFEKRFSDVEIRTVFVLGIDGDESIQKRIDEENRYKGDIVQADFKDTYYNNTIKTMMSFKWAVYNCNNSKFYFFSDDDMYISTKNVLRFVRNPLEYPGYLEVPVKYSHVDMKSMSNTSNRKLGLVFDMELPNDAELYAGYVFNNSRPMRFMSSKWYVPLSEYPYNAWPPYVTAGAYVLSNRALHKLYFASMYVKHFRFDDIYLSMLASSVKITPLHNSEFYFYKKSYDPYDYRYVIASHGFENPSELQWIWNEQKSHGNA